MVHTYTQSEPPRIDPKYLVIAIIVVVIVIAAVVLVVTLSVLCAQHKLDTALCRAPDTPTTTMMPPT